MASLSRTYSALDVVRCVGAATVIGNALATFDRIEPINEATPGALAWLRAEHPFKNDLLRGTRASVVIIDEHVHIDASTLDERAIIRVSNPETAFLAVLKTFCALAVPTGAHPTALVDVYASLGRDVYVGPYAIVGRCRIGDGSRIDAHTIIHDRVTIGRNVVIREHCSIGGAGFSHVSNEQGVPENFPHIGSTIIEDDVEIFPFSNVDRATLSVTLIKKGAKIDHYCHIGHNSTVGEYAIIMAGVVLCGGSSVADYARLGVGAIIRDGLRVGVRSFVGMGSLVTKNVPDGESWVGAPAMPLDTFKRLQAARK